MVKPSSITYKQKVLIYLDRFSNLENDDRGEKPEDITQKGIAENLNISRTHVSRIVKKLNEEGSLKEKKESVKGHHKKLKTYYLTSQGIKKVERLLSELSEIKVDLVIDSEEKELSVTKIEEETDGEIDALTALHLIEDSKDNRIDMEELTPKEPVVSTEDAHKVEEIYGREEELKEMKDWLEENTPVMAVLGRRGSGASTLASKFIDDVEGMHILWIDLKKVSVQDLEDKLSTFLDKIENQEADLDVTDTIDELLNKYALLIFDDYQEVQDEIVHFLSRLLQEFENVSEGKRSLKVMITGRVGTPFYQRFYQQEQIERGLVKEVKLSPLNKDDAQRIIGDEIKEDAMERIMMFTKGSPLLLKLLREGKEEELCQITPWEKEQISLLMYLKTKRK